MQIERVHSWKKTGVQCLLLALPTVLFAFLVLYRLNNAYTILQSQWIYQGIYFAAGIFFSIIFYGWRFRFISTAASLALFFFLGYKILREISAGEFDVFFFSVQYVVFVVIFLLGWLVGFGFSRLFPFTVAWVLLLLSIEIILTSKADTVTANTIVFSYAPVLLYGFYIIYTAELVRSLNEHQSSFSWFLTKRMMGFFAIAVLVVAIAFLLFRKELSEIERAWKNVQPNYSAEKNNSQSMTKSNRDGSMSNNGQMPLGGSLNKTKQLVFVAHLNNPFPGTDMQNPLYFTSGYYTKFDSATQTFETDSLMPSNDLYSPNPSRIPLFFSQADSNIIRRSQATVDRKVVETEVYKVALSSSDFVAPNTAFAVQPIPVPREYEGQYTSAYRAKMWVSELNSAYFVYNPAGDSSLEHFQQQRFTLLRNDTGYTGIDSSFMQYYTRMPQSKSYHEISALAQQIAARDSAKTTIDKMLAIRNYFLSKDEFGQPLFQYTDNPGEPGLPNANRLTYFLFDNRKGYCAYFAGATLFMLRALHIPSRIATGFLTVDRSSKNPGWYWFYEDQAHAWVQVFFPGYGWIDFDTTIPDVNTQQAPQPDGTPPLGTQKVYFVGDGIIENIDTAKKELQLSVNKILYREMNFTAHAPVIIQTNIAQARCSTDTGSVKVSDLKTGMHITAASYDQRLDNVELVRTDDTAMYILTKLEKPINIDEIKITEQATASKKPTKSFLNMRALNWSNVLLGVLVLLVAAALITLFAPWFVWQYYNLFAKRNIQYANRAILYYLNQLSYSRATQSPQAFAEQIDGIFHTDFAHFNQIYQKEKYGNLSITEEEHIFAKQFYPLFIQQIRKQIPWKERARHFFNFSSTLFFFTKH